ncbi:16452_t:CDS:2, partial [Acaulospora colombiana]
MPAIGESSRAVHRATTGIWLSLMEITLKSGAYLPSPHLRRLNSDYISDRDVDRFAKKTLGAKDRANKLLATYQSALRLSFDQSTMREYFVQGFLRCVNAKGDVAIKHSASVISVLVATAFEFRRPSDGDKNKIRAILSRETVRAGGRASHDNCALIVTNTPYGDLLKEDECARSLGLDTRQSCCSMGGGIYRCPIAFWLVFYHRNPSSRTASTSSLAAPLTHFPLPPLAHQSHSDSAASGILHPVTLRPALPSPTVTGADLSDKHLRTGMPSSSPNAAIISITVTPGANGVESESTSTITSFADNDLSPEKAEDACYASGPLGPCVAYHLSEYGSSFLRGTEAC